METQNSPAPADGDRFSFAAILLVVLCLLALAVVFLLPPHTMETDAVYQGF